MSYDNYAQFRTSYTKPSPQTSFPIHMPFRGSYNTVDPIDAIKYGGNKFTRQGEQFHLKESYADIPSAPYKLWGRMFFKAIHIMARTYAPVDENVRTSMKCFFQCLAELLPVHEARQNMQNFIMMTSNVCDALLSSKALASFFTVHVEMMTCIRDKPSKFFEYALTDSDTLFAWSYLLHCYINIAKDSNKAEIINYNTAKTLYDRNTLSKEDWGNALWFVIHCAAYYAPNILSKEFALTFKAFIACLQFILPCPKCRKHMQENLGNIDIDMYLYTNESIFEWTWKFHNIVNKQTGKSEPTLEEARRIYSPYEQQYVKQNVSYVSGFATRSHY